MTKDEKKAFLKKEAAKPKVYAGACGAGAPRRRRLFTAALTAACPPLLPPPPAPPISAHADVFSVNLCGTKLKGCKYCKKPKAGTCQPHKSAKTGKTRMVCKRSKKKDKATPSATPAASPTRKHKA